MVGSIGKKDGIPSANCAAAEQFVFLTRRTAEAVAGRRDIAALIRGMRASAEAVEPTGASGGC